MSENSELFASMGLEDVEANPNFIADGTYPAYVFESSIIVPKTGKNQGKASWVITYKLAGGKYDKRTQQEWFSLDPANEVVKPWLKLRMLSLGVPETKIGEFKPQDVVGTPVFVKIVKSGEYQNVREVKIREEGQTQAPTTTAQGAASGDSAKMSDLL